MTQKKTQLVIQFAKAPIPGQVKTRLTPEFTAAEATAIHCQLVQATANVLLQAKVDQVQLHVAGGLTDPFIQAFQQQGFALFDQVSGDLGEKMRAALNQGLAEFDQVLLVGSDCPALSPAVLEAAFSALSSGHALVLNPAEDGGYVLIGANAPVPAEVLQGVRWGTESVLQETLVNSQKAGLVVACLPELWDVDFPADVRRWRQAC